MFKQQNQNKWQKRALPNPSVCLAIQLSEGKNFKTKSNQKGKHLNSHAVNVLSHTTSSLQRY